MTASNLSIVTLAALLLACDDSAPNTAAPQADDTASAALSDEPVITIESDDPMQLRAELGELARPMDDALQSLSRLHRLDLAQGLRPFRADVDELGMTHIRVQQEMNGVPVWGGEAILHIDVDGRMGQHTDKLIHEPTLDTTPVLSADEGIELAAADYAAAELDEESGEPTLYVMRHEGTDHLVYEVKLVERDADGNPTAMPVVFVDAHDGAVLWSYDNLKSGYGNTHYNGYVYVPTTANSSWGYAWYSLSTSRLLGNSAGGGTTAGSTVVNYFTDAFTTQTSPVSAYWAANKTLDYLSAYHGYAGVDGRGTQVTVIADYGTNYDNAHGGGTTVMFGNGSGGTFGSLTSADIVAHELGHCMTDANARLVYSGESGGLNESFSDVMGALVDRYIDGSVNSDTWKIGEDAFTPGTSGDALRYMASPASDGGSLDFYTTSAGSVDVHYSSGIPNLAFKLLATGGSHPRLGGSYVNGLGIDAAAWIWMRAHRYYMTSTSTFSDARNATMLASADGYGASTWITASVDAAWDNVGVYGDLAQTGYLSGAGAGANLPNGSYYYSASNGNHSGKLQPNTAGVNFALYLYKWNGSAWAYVAGSATGSGNQSVTYAGTPGYYIWMAYSHSGAGNFTAMLAHP